MDITSLQNPRVKRLIKLKNRRQRDEEGVILIEGYRALMHAESNHFAISEVYFCPELYLGDKEPGLVASAVQAGAASYRLTPQVFEKISYRDRPDGLLAVGPQFRTELTSLSNDEHALFVAAESIEKPGNLGSILRSCDAAGASLIACDPKTDAFNPNVVRASIGTLFTVPMVQTSNDEFFAWAKKTGVKIVATTPSATVSYTDVDLTGRVAIAAGTEQYGLSDAWLERADVNVVIPMYGQADSLNVAAATTLVIFEAVRQRREKGLLA